MTAPVRLVKPLATACGEGTVWDSNTSSCIVANPTDTDLDGCTGVGDVLEVLSTFGQCYTTWACGDPMNYHGYDYATVLIGDQCWFAENLRTDQYANGDAIPANLTDGEWSSTTLGATTVYGENPSNLETYGRLYNWYAVDDARGLCPSGWHVPTDGEWMTMEIALGMSEEHANDTGWRGTDQGTQMKASPFDNPGWNGTNSFGFSGLPGGFRNFDAAYYYLGNDATWWTSSPNGSDPWMRVVVGYNDSVIRGTSGHLQGRSVRCLKDIE